MTLRRLLSSRLLSSRGVPLQHQHVKYLWGARSFMTASFQYRAMGEERVTRFITEPLQADFIPSLKKPVQQVLWIGCSDSGFHETTIVDLLRDEMIVHRNMGNMIVDGDLSCEIAVRYAVTALQVGHQFSREEVTKKSELTLFRSDTSWSVVIMNASLSGLRQEAAWRENGSSIISRI